MDSATGPGPNDLMPCPSESAVLRHKAKAQTCEVCGVGYEPLPAATREAVNT